MEKTANTGRRQLQRLRRDAGFRTAADFAEKLHIPNSTYSRYERSFEDPACCCIPLGAAWVIADELGCSIDLVVGREDMDSTSDGLDERVGKLGRTGREMFDDYLRYLEFREDAIAAQDWRR